MAVGVSYNLDAERTPGVCHAPTLTKESADAANEVLQSNRKANHVFTTSEAAMGASLHNHIVHHTMTLFAMGASPEQIKAHAERNTTYQLLPPMYADDKIVESMTNDEEFKRYLGDESYYLNFVEFFDRQISRLGYEAVLQKYLFDEGEIARDMLPRIYMGYVHGLMYCGLSLEFKQPAVLSEGLAQSAVHHDMWYTKFLQDVDEAAQKRAESALSLSECVDACLEDPVVTSCSSVDYHFQISDDCWFIEKEMVKDGVVANASKELGRICARYRVDSDNLERAAAEQMNTAVYIAAGAQRPPHECRYDFFLIHGSNASIWLTSFLKEPSMTNKQKARLLEYTGRVILMLYAAMGCPKPAIEWIESHRAQFPGSDWSQLFERAVEHKDDGHMSKLVRSLRYTQEVSKQYDDLPEFRMKQKHFLPAANAALDSGSAKPMDGVWHFDFVRGAAYPRAWELIPERGQGKASNGDKVVQAWRK